MQKNKIGAQHLKSKLQNASPLCQEHEEFKFNKVRLIFLSRVPPIISIRDKLGIQCLLDDGFDLLFMDLSDLLETGAGKAYSHVEKFDDIPVLHVQSYNQLADFFASNNHGVIYIENAFAPSDIPVAFEKYFRLLKKFSIRYYVVYTGSLPPIDSAMPRGEKIKATIAKVLNPFVFIDFIARRCFSLLSWLGLIYPSPLRVFGSHTATLDRYCWRVGINPNSMIEINSHDYDLYMQGLGENDLDKTREDICVFLDDDLTNHPDYRLLSIEGLNPEKYFSSLLKFFSRVEAATGLQVVVALHPKSRFTAQDNPFRGLRVSKNNTKNIVAQSKLVIAHSSTSISFAAIYKRPLILIFTREMVEKSILKNAVDAVGEAVGIKAINIDSDKDIREGYFDYPLTPDYQKYLHLYVRPPKSAEKLNWNIVGDFVKKDISEGCA